MLDRCFFEWLLHCSFRAGAIHMPGRDRSSGTTEVLILGAGIAGIAAASELSRHGVRGTLLEARNRMGGRIWTDRDPSFPAWIDLGAEFVHGFPAETMQLARERSLPIYEVPDRHRLHQGRELRDFPDF